MEFTSKTPNVPTDPQALRQLERHVEFGELRELGSVALPNRATYLVTYMNSQTAGRTRSATVVSVTNQSRKPDAVTVTWFKGFSDNNSPVGSSSMVIPPDFTVDFGTRDLPTELSVVNSIPGKPLVFDEGRGIVSSRNAEIAVSARVYYTSGERDEQLLAITDSKVVLFGSGNTGD